MKEKKSTKNKKKIPYTSKTPKKAASRYTGNEDYSWRVIPYTDAMIEDLAIELEDWAQMTTSLYINTFYLTRKKKMARCSFHNLRKRSTALQSAYDFALEMIGIRREEAIHKGEADRHTISWRQTVYSDEVKDVEAWRSGLKEGENKAGAGNYTIEVQPVPTSEMVPVKRKEE